MNGENYDIILGISAYYTESYIIYVFMTSCMISYLYLSGARQGASVSGRVGDGL